MGAPKINLTVVESLFALVKMRLKTNPIIIPNATLT